MSHWSKAIMRSGPKVIWDYFSWMIRYSGKKRNKYPIEKRYSKLKKLISRVNRGFDVQIHVEGKENLLEGPFLMCPNHLSSYDPLLLVSILDTPTTFVAKKEIAKYPFVNKCTRVIDGAFMDRHNLKQSLKVMMHVEESLKNKEMNWIIFPEGTRNKDRSYKQLLFRRGGTYQRMYSVSVF
jgi:1-acyl-sn-glycerol-3-phosphate acyltransferase